MLSELVLETSCAGEFQIMQLGVTDQNVSCADAWPCGSYQRVNNSYGCANSKTLNGLLKTELGFQGFVVTDWNAQRTLHHAHKGQYDLQKIFLG